MMYSSEEFKEAASHCEACMVAEVYIDDHKIGNEMKVKGSAQDIVRMLGALVSYVGQQIVDMKDPENFARYLHVVSSAAIDSLDNAAKGRVDEEYNHKSVLK